MTQVCLPQLWLSEWEMNILVGWEQLSHRMFYLPYPQPGLILDLCQSPFLSLKINENYLISHAQIKMYASFISTTIFCFLPMLYLKAHKTNGFVLIKRKALETSYSLPAPSCTDECKLLINPFKLKDVVKLTVFWKPGGICRHMQHQGTYLFTSMLQRNTFRKQQESPTQETWEETSSCNCLGLLPTIFFVTSTFRVLRDDFSLCPSCHQHEKLLLGSSFSSSRKTLPVLWQGSCYLWQLMPFQCLLWLP